MRTSGISSLSASDIIDPSTLDLTDFIEGKVAGLPIKKQPDSKRSKGNNPSESVSSFNSKMSYATVAINDLNKDKAAKNNLGEINEENSRDMLEINSQDDKY
jgi:hypothetical protein